MASGSGAASGAASDAGAQERHYLRRELDALFGDNPALVDFLGVGCMDGLWYWDLERPEHEWMNSRFWEILGHDPATKSHFAAEWQDMIDPDDLALALENFKRHCADPAHPYDQVVRYRHRDGSTVWVRCRGIAIRDASGAPKRMLGLHTDVTPLKMREAELEAVNAQLEHFASVAAHDLQAPLRRALVYLSMIEERFAGRAGDGADAALAGLAGQLSQMKALVRSIRRLSDIKAREIEREPVDLNQIVAECRETLTPEIDAAAARVEAGRLPTVSGDATLLRQVFANLIGNAVKYGGKRGLTVRLYAAAGGGDGDRPRVLVEDDGVGVPAGQHEAIFNMFTRLHHHSDAPGEGSGLAGCRQVMALHDGAILCDPSFGDGARFAVVFRV